MGISTTCEGCAHASKTETQDPCRTCWDPRGIKVNWERNMSKEGLYIEAYTKDAAPPTGRKDDGGKLDVTLFFDDLPHAIEAVTEVLQWAITKKQPTPYERGSWQNVDDFSRRYRGALLRHQINRAKALKGAVISPAGEPTDAETGLMELAHIATDAMFLLEMAVRKAKGLPTPAGA